MIKQVLLLSSILLALPVLAAKQPGSEKGEGCPSVKELSASTMGTFYSVRPKFIHAEVKYVNKREDVQEVVSVIETTHMDQVCTIEWATPPLGCMSQLRSLSCSSKEKRAEEEERLAHLRKRLREVYTASDIEKVATDHE